MRCPGVGLGAGVGGEAGAEGSMLCGIFVVKGLVGVCILCGCRLRLEIEGEEDVKAACGDGGASSSSENGTVSMLTSSSAMLLALDRNALSSGSIREEALQQRWCQRLLRCVGVKHGSVECRMVCWMAE
jgi:hypothetical protein